MMQNITNSSPARDAGLDYRPLSIYRSSVNPGLEEHTITCETFCELHRDNPRVRVARQQASVGASWYLATYRDGKLVQLDEFFRPIF